MHSRRLLGVDTLLVRCGKPGLCSLQTVLRTVDLRTALRRTVLISLGSGHGVCPKMCSGMSVELMNV